MAQQPDWMDFAPVAELVRGLIAAQDTAEATRLVVDYVGEGRMSDLSPRERRLMTLATLVAGIIAQGSKDDPALWQRVAANLDAHVAVLSPKVPDGESRRVR